MEPTRGNGILARIIEKSDFFSLGKQDYSNNSIVHACLDVLLTCHRKEGAKVLVSSWMRLLGASFDFDKFLEGCKEKYLSFGSCTNGKLLQETFAFTDLQRKSLEDIYAESSISENLSDCEAKRTVDFEFNPQTLIWAKVLGVRTSAESRGNLDLDLEVKQELKGGFDKKKLTIKWPYLDTQFRTIRPGPEVGMELLVPFQEESSLIPNFSECILIANQKNAKALRTKDRKMLIPYSQNLCLKSGKSLEDRTWIDVRSRTIHGHKQGFIRFQPTTGQEVVLTSNDDPGESSRNVTQIRTDCVNQYLVIKEVGHEWFHLNVYSSLTGESLFSEQEITFSSDGRYALGWSQPDYNAQYESTSVEVIKFSDGKVEHLWSKGDRKIRFDSDNDGVPVFDKRTVKFIVREIVGDLPEPEATEDSESSSGITTHEIRQLKISCPLDTNKKCTEKEIARFSEGWRPG